MKLVSLKPKYLPNSYCKDIIWSVLNIDGYALCIKNNSENQSITIFTLRQQLYRVALDVIWSDALTWNRKIPKLGGMH